MKKIFFVAFVATLLAVSCQKTEIINPVNPKGTPSMTFTTNMSKLTKASGTPADADADGMVNLQAQDFRVWAYADYEDENTSATELDQIYDKMANLNIGYTAAVDALPESWAPAKEYYWPGVGKNLRFFAVSGVDLGDDLSETTVVVPTITRTTNNDAVADDPATEDIDETTPATTTVTSQLVVNDFVVNHASPNADLMVADFVCQNQTTKEVTLKFRHALSKVEFLFKTTDAADAKVFVQGLSVENVMTKSTLTVTENTGADKETKPMTFTWGVPTVNQIFVDDYKPTEAAAIPSDTELLPSNTTLDTDALELTNQAHNFTTWLVMPQTIAPASADAKGLQVKIVYVIGKRQFESIFPLYTDDLKEWKANQYVRYTITLAPNLISFKPSVQPWDQYDAVAGNETTDDIEMQN